MNIAIEKLKQSDAEKLFEFEGKNRTYFETMIPGRGDDYYEFETFIKRHTSLLEEHSKGVSYYYLIKDTRGFILGRINLADISEQSTIGYLGYRIGQAQAGKGIATKALGLFLNMMTDKGIKKIKAKTTTDNIGSQKILERNGFKLVSTDDKMFEMNGQKMQFIHYIWPGDG
ncbi:GNAT family N-acetyltransferase [Salipaludibacillus aurantiacus]|uniref:Ribosomal-protein-alanine N-acetyltransferase n=1 Tax=Salipaludibacillus aurantiacus TaxID=1601833 RepID=A0A1H9QBA3_9BACI|nr:GNAT family N-acetyltransferase [Salipaludibacillus aurantiacus]SER57707.1 ribosomal-protein-alanine N-acetyltransferase [Salipaludibacillus aurantiacus]